jgi:hypothetical protein
LAPCELHAPCTTQGTTLAGEARDQRRNHGPPATGLSQTQIWRSPPSSQGPEERGQSGRVPSYRGGSHRAQHFGGNGRHRQALATAAGLGAQVRQPARAHASQPSLHVNLWLDFKEVFAKGSASSKRMAVDQGGPGAAGNGQRRKEDRYTLDAALDQPCKFESTLGREATHSTRQCSFIKELELCARQLPGSPPEQPTEGQEDNQHKPAAE